MADQEVGKLGFHLLVGIEDDTPRPAPEAANWFQVSRLEQDFQMLVGYLDLQKIASLRESAPNTGEVTMHPDVTHRFLISWRGFFILRAMIEDLVTKLRAQGVEVPPLEADAQQTDSGTED